jgi:hypothetical protein
MLIFKYGCNIDVCAQNGLRPRDLIQFPSNKQMFQKFYTFVDKRVQLNQVDQIQRDSLLQENNVRLITKRSIVDDIIAKRNAVDVRGTMMAPAVPNSRQSTPNSLASKTKYNDNCLHRDELLDPEQQRQQDEMAEQICYDNLVRYHGEKNSLKHAG